jgi:hypothetical protein
MKAGFPKENIRTPTKELYYEMTDLHFEKIVNTTMV